MSAVDRTHAIATRPHYTRGRGSGDPVSKTRSGMEPRKVSSIINIMVQRQTTEQGPLTAVLLPELHAVMDNEYAIWMRSESEEDNRTKMP